MHCSHSSSCIQEILIGTLPCNFRFCTLPCYFRFCTLPCCLILFSFDLMCCRKDIITAYDKEKMMAIQYMSMMQSRVAVTTDMWTADNQKKGYMAVTGHFVDESWKLRSILMGYVNFVFAHCLAYCWFSPQLAQSNVLCMYAYCRFIYVPAPHTGDVIAEELHETLMQWNLDA